MTRGALYHQFADKADLFAAVLDEAEAEIAQRVAGAVAGLDPADTTGMLLAGADAWLDASTEPDLQRIVLLDGPSEADDRAAARADMDLVLRRLTLALATPT